MGAMPQDFNLLAQAWEDLSTWDGAFNSTLGL